LQEAIENCGEGQTIELLRSIPLFASDSSVTIEEGKNIILNMEGNSIVSALEEATIQNRGILTLKNGRIQANSLENIGSMKIEESTIKTVQNTQGTIEMQSGTIEVLQDNQGMIIQNAGNINTLTTNDGTFIQNNGTTGSITNRQGNVTILEGTVDSINSTGTVTIGTKDGIVKGDSPVITGNSDNTTTYYGITNDGGQLYFYDGTIKGATAAINGTITEIEENTELLISTDENNYEVAQLQTVEGNVASVNGIEYATLQKAIDACSENVQTMIQILRNSVVASAKIESNQNIEIDLNGKTLTQYNTITNNGTLQIIDNSTSKGGSITSYQRTAIQNNGNLTFTSGTITGNTYGISNSGTASIVGGAFENNTHGLYNTGTASIGNGTFKNNQYGASQYGSGTTTITGGTFQENTNGTYGASGTIVVENATFNSNENANTCAGGRISVIGGTFSGNQYGALCTSGQFFAGIKDTSVSKEAPNIIGEIAGIKIQTLGILHFYDGKIQGKEASIQGNVTYLEDGYKMKAETIDGYDTTTLALSGTIITVAKVGDVEFSNLQSAINSCIGEELQTVTLINSVTTTETIRIAEDQKVLIDLNKHTIEGVVNGSILDNLGTLTIQDTSTEKTGAIRNTAGVGIHNTGTLTLGTNDGTIEESLVVEGTTKAVETTGTFNYYDGILKATTPVDGTITNLPDKAVVRTRTEDGKVVYYIG